MIDVHTDKDCSPDEIRHNGIVSKVDNKIIYVSILAQSACNACQAKGICNVSDLKEEVVEVPRDNRSNYKIGDEVEVLMEKSMGVKAVMLGYVVPFILLLVTLIIAMNFVKSEGIAGLFSLGILIPYYSILFFFRDYLKNTFVFRIR